MKRNLIAIAKRYITPCKSNSRVMVKDAEVADIIEVIMHADKYSADSAKRFAPFIKGSSDYETLNNVWKFVKKFIRYQRDKPGHEVVKTPGCTLRDGYADCKSMSVLVGSILRGLGYNFFYRVAFYDSSSPEQGHIYAVANIGGEEIPVDPVHNRFDAEEPYWTNKDYHVNNVSINGVVSTSTNWGAIGFLALLGTLGIMTTQMTNND